MTKLHQSTNGTDTNTDTDTDTDIHHTTASYKLLLTLLLPAPLSPIALQNHETTSQLVSYSLVVVFCFCLCLFTQLRWGSTLVIHVSLDISSSFHKLNMDSISFNTMLMGGCQMQPFHSPCGFSQPFLLQHSCSTIT